MYAHIQRALQKIEQEHDMKIIYACEAGSRAWGIQSADSDYDVRFLYIHRPEWYLSIEQKQDVLQYPINEQLDISGWDFRKALQLLMKSNPALLEWLQSPIIYEENSNITEKLRNISKLCLSKKASMYHYLHMAQGNYRHYLQGDMVDAKKYFYVLRPLLVCRWLEQKTMLPPVAFEKLLDIDNLPPAVHEEIRELIQRKRVGDVLREEPYRPLLHTFIAEQFAYYEQHAQQLEQLEPIHVEVLNTLFRTALQEVWSLPC